MTRDADVFSDALELPVSERATFLDDVCGSDAILRARVEALLALHDEAPEFLNVPLSPRDADPREEKPGDQIGRYKLLQQIGEGGCGIVYMAEQKEPIRRRVALKIIKLGMDTKAVIARFGAEQQALAMMDHPNIAKVFDGGASDSGRPYFVMEFVQGVPITKYCDEHSLPTCARLELFTRVCRAIGHAHQHGIVHRDIKPSNILVSLHDGVPVPKVIDFGIAKATQGRLTEATFFTAVEQLIGTPAYMSPEQAELSNVEVDPRSDIYSLGVLLYELLTGRPPFEGKTLIQAGLDEMRRQIREVEPPRPSARLRTLEKKILTTTAERRDTGAPELIKLVHGDLDWIVMRCLEKDCTRRYESADDLAADIDRHLRHVPVSARPPRLAYRLGKSIRRNKPVFIAAAVVLTGGFAWWLEHRMSNSPPPDSQSVAVPPRAAYLPHQKSLAVLPFANMSEDKDSSAFFSEGMHDDITTNLALIRELRVVSRTTATQYRNTRKTLRQIGEELQVAYVLEGSVRREGSTVRISGKLIDARNDEHVWAKTFNGDLNDMFALQAAVAQEVADALRAAISPQEKSLLNRRPTDNIAAYDLLLKAREFRRSLNNYRKGPGTIALLEEALRLDPNLVPAWVELTYLEGLRYQNRYWNDTDPVAQAEYLARAKRAVEAAVTLAPDSPEVIRSLAEYYYRCHFDLPRALEQLEKLRRLEPNNEAGLALVAHIQRRQGRWTECLATLRRVVRLDPGNFTNGRDLVSVLAEARRFDEARREQQRIAERQPYEEVEARFELAYMSFLAAGSSKEVEAFFRQLPAQQVNGDMAVRLRKHWALRRGDSAEVVRLDRIQPAAHYEEVLAMAVISATHGDMESARARLGNLPTALQEVLDKDPDNHLAWAKLAKVQALLGHKEEALRCARRSSDLVPISRDAVYGARARANLAFVKAWTGDKEGAIVDYAELLRIPYGGREASNRWHKMTTVHVMKHDPHYSPLHGDPRFEALLDDPKNNEPLF